MLELAVIILCNVHADLGLLYLSVELQKKLTSLLVLLSLMLFNPIATYNMTYKEHLLSQSIILRFHSNGIEVLPLESWAQQTNEVFTSIHNYLIKHTIKR